MEEGDAGVLGSEAVVVTEARVEKVEEAEESEQGSGAVVAEMKEGDAIVLGSGAVVAGKVEEGEESELGRGVLNELQALQLLLFERLAHIFVSVFLDALRSGCINPIS